MTASQILDQAMGVLETLYPATVTIQANSNALPVAYPCTITEVEEMNIKLEAGGTFETGATEVLIRRSSIPVGTRFAPGQFCPSLVDEVGDNLGVYSVVRARRASDGVLLTLELRK